MSLENSDHPTPNRPLNALRETLDDPGLAAQSPRLHARAVTVEAGARLLGLHEVYFPDSPTVLLPGKPRSARLERTIAEMSPLQIRAMEDIARVLTRIRDAQKTNKQGGSRQKPAAKVGGVR